MKKIYTLLNQSVFKRAGLLIIATLFCFNMNAQTPARNWGTYYGGTGNGEAGSVVVEDGNGNTYIVGKTPSTSAISTVGSHQPTFGGGPYDAFLAKFNSAGVRQWATYYGGTLIDEGFSIAVDGNGNVYITGYAASTSAISTVGSHQATFGGGTRDAFLVKFDSAGVLQWATYYGGTGDEVGQSIVVDGSGNIYLSGSTTSTTAISTVGSYQATFAGGANDAFLVQFNTAGVRQWATYYGGTGDDQATSVALDGSGFVNISGSTTSTTAISTVGSHQPAYGGGGTDAFLVKFNTAGVRQWATYYGGSTFDFANSVVVDLSGNIFVTGYTASATAISTVGSHQTVYGGANDAFLVEFNSAGIRQWATYYGGTATDIGYSAALDINGNIYLAGRSASTTSISTVGSYQTVLGGATTNAILVKFNNSGVRQWGTYYGGTGFDYASSVVVDSIGTIYISGSASSTTAISSLGSHQPTNGGSSDGFLVQFDGCLGVPTQPTSISGTATICSGTTNTYSITAVAGATSYTWTLPSGWTGTSTTNSINATASATSGNITVTANNTCGNSTAQTLAIVVNTIPATPGTISGLATICSGTTNTYSITAVAGATSYTWALPGGWTGTSTTNSINATASATSGNIAVTANNSCGNSTAQTLAVVVNSIPATPGTISGTATICSGTTNTYSITAVAGATSYTWTLPSGWSGTSTTNSINATASATSGNITVTANNACGNSTAQTLAVVVNSIPAIPGTISGTTTICSGSSNTYSITAVAGATSYTWTLPSGWSGTSTTNSINTTASTTSGNITVTATNACGTSASATLAITVNTVPVLPSSITGNTSFCANATAQTYSVTNDVSATSYSWILPSGWSGISTTNSINATASSSSGTITVTANNGCGASAVQSLVVTVNPLPSVGLTLTVDTLCIDDTPLTLSGGSPSGGTFSGTGVSSGNFDPNTAGAGTHVINYTFTDGNSCANTATDTIVVDLCLALPDEASAEEEIIVYPNPTTSVVTLSGVGGTATIEVYNVLGKIVLSKQITKDNTEINLSNETNGIYFMKIITEKGAVTKRILKQ